MKTFRMEKIPVSSLTAIDLSEEAYGRNDAEAYRITIYRADESQEAQHAQGLYLPGEGRLGVAWGADASWADARDVESGIEMWLNDEEAWLSSN